MLSLKVQGLQELRGSCGGHQGDTSLLFQQVKLVGALGKRTFPSSPWPAEEVLQNGW